MSGRAALTTVWGEIITHAQDMVTEVAYRMQNGSWADILFPKVLRVTSRENLSESHHEWVTKRLPNNKLRQAPEQGWGLCFLL
jgi:hypothetical protein